MIELTKIKISPFTLAVHSSNLELWKQGLLGAPTPTILTSQHGECQSPCSVLIASVLDEGDLFNLFSLKHAVAIHSNKTFLLKSPGQFNKPFRKKSFFKTESKECGTRTNPCTQTDASIAYIEGSFLLFSYCSRSAISFLPEVQTWLLGVCL